MKKRGLILMLFLVPGIVVFAQTGATSAHGGPLVNGATSAHGGPPVNKVDRLKMEREVSNTNSQKSSSSQIIDAMDRDREESRKRMQDVQDKIRSDGDEALNKMRARQAQTAADEDEARRERAAQAREEREEEAARQRREEAERERARQQREAEERERARIQREKEEARKREEEKQRKAALLKARIEFMNAIDQGTYPTALTQAVDNTVYIYFIGWDEITDESFHVNFSSPVALRKLSDDTWPLSTKIFLDCYNYIPGRNKKMICYYPSTEACVGAEEQMKSSLRELGASISDVFMNSGLYSNGPASRNNGTNSTGKDFWGNKKNSTVNNDTSTAAVSDSTKIKTPKKDFWGKNIEDKKPTATTSTATATVTATANAPKKEQMAKSCGGGCSTFTVTKKNKDDHFKFIVTNNSKDDMYLELLDKQIKQYSKTGYWKSDGYMTIHPGGNGEFDSYGSTGTHIIFYRVVGSHDYFPSESMVDKMIH